MSVVVPHVKVYTHALRPNIHGCLLYTYMRACNLFFHYTLLHSLPLLIDSVTLSLARSRTRTVESFSSYFLRCFIPCCVPTSRVVTYCLPICIPPSTDVCEKQYHGMVVRNYDTVNTDYLHRIYDHGQQCDAGMFSCIVYCIFTRYVFDEHTVSALTVGAFTAVCVRMGPSVGGNTRGSAVHCGRRRPAGRVYTSWRCPVVAAACSAVVMVTTIALISIKIFCRAYGYRWGQKGLGPDNLAFHVYRFSCFCFFSFLRLCMRYYYRLCINDG